VLVVATSDNQNEGGDQAIMYRHNTTVTGLAASILQEI